VATTAGSIENNVNGKSNANPIGSRTAMSAVNCIAQSARPSTGAAIAIHAHAGPRPVCNWPTSTQAAKQPATASTQELAISLVDLDADNFVHWVVTGLDPASTGIAAGRVPAGAVQAANGFGESKYSGPCPPDGQHKYLLTLYALGARSNLADGVAGATAIDQLRASAQSSALVTGSFG